MARRPRLKAISLYTGVGGLDFGFEAAGFKTAVACELDPTCCKTLELNRSWPVIQGDLGEVSSEDILETAGLDVGEADVLIGGPPCQPFSKSGYWAAGDSKRLRDPRAATLEYYIRVLRDTQPKAFLLENVKGLMYRGKDEGLLLLLDGIEKINRECGTSYQVSHDCLNAADYGVPQFRERVFLIGSRDGRRFEFPEPTHGSGRKQPYHTVWDALGDLPDELDEPELRVGGKWGDLLPSIPEGESYLFHTARGGGLELFGWRRRYWNFLLKLSKSQPSWTIQAQPGTATGPFHWANRRLSAVELCRLQTIPDNLVFDCGRTDIQRLIGNAVPSLIAEVLAREIRRQLLRRPRKGPLALEPPYRGTPPAARKPRRVPKKYHHLVGDHEEHPGTGLGPAYRPAAGSAH